MFSLNSTLLILVDIQGRLASLMYDKKSLYKNLEILVKSMNILNVPIVWMEHVPDKLGSTIKEVSNLLPDLKPLSKFTYSCCGNDEFVKEVASYKNNQILVAGIETHICVYQTAMDLLGNSYEVQVVEDCVSSRTEANKVLGLKRIVQAGGLTTSTEMILFELMKSTKAQGFKEITQLIK